MTDLYLLAHKCHGEPAFDIAARMTCPICHGEPENDPDSSGGCYECDDLGYWWIIPTSGHRAYPYWEIKLNDLFAYTNVGSPPPNLPDHYIAQSAPRQSLTTALGLGPKAGAAPAKPFPRRI